jgi:SLOG cluster4 family
MLLQDGLCSTGVSVGVLPNIPAATLIQMMSVIHGKHRRRVIVGVLGRTFFEFEEEARYRHLDRNSKLLLAQAKEVGSLLTRLQHVVLTDGTLCRPEISVRHFVLRAAERGGVDSATARLASILPNDESLAQGLGDACYERVKSKRATIVHLHAVLSALERETVLGTAADVFIALAGGRNTARKVAAAIEAGRPVVFLNSLEQLAEATRKERSANRHNRRLFPASRLTATDAKSAVEIALQVVQRNPFRPELRGAIRRYEDMLSWPRTLTNNNKVLADLEAEIQLLLS